MSRTDTKQIIVNTFRDNVRSTSYSQIRIATLIEMCSISRTAFYYHFSSKLAIARYAFLSDLSSLLKHTLPESKIVFSQHAGEEAFAYYMHDEIGAHALNASEFFKSISRCICDDERFYRGLIAKGNREFLEDMLLTYKKVALDDVNFILGGRTMSLSERDFMATMLAKNVVSTMEYAIQHPENAREIIERGNESLWNAPHDAIHNIVEKRFPRFGSRTSF